MHSAVPRNATTLSASRDLNNLKAAITLECLRFLCADHIEYSKFEIETDRMENEKRLFPTMAEKII